MGKESGKNHIRHITHFFHASPENTLAYHRVTGPAKCLGLNVIHGFCDGKIEVESVLEGDLVVMQRDFPRFSESYERIITLAKEENKPVLLDLDDLLFRLPEDHPDRKGFDYTEALLPMLKALIEVDMITVPTAPLQEYFLNYNSNVNVLPNYLNDTLWTLRTPTMHVDQNRPITIAYMGSDSHAADLEMLVSTTLDLVKRYPSKLQLKFYGAAPPSDIAMLPQCEHFPLQIYEYPEFVATFQDQSADIFIAPLVDSVFNSHKSAIKFLEYSALGIPGVYSNIQPYSSVIKNGYDGFLASTPGEWLDYLGELIENPKLRIEMASNAQDTIQTRWLLSKNSHLWLETYQGALTRKSSERSVSPMLPTLKSIISQSVEFKESQGQEIQALNVQVREYEGQEQLLSSQLAELDREVQALNTQVTEFAQQVQMLDTQVVEYEGRIQTLTDQVALRDHQVKVLREQLVDREHQIQALREHLIDREYQIQALREQVIERDQKLQAFHKQLTTFEQQVGAMDAQLREITLSEAWRVVKFMRAIWAFLFPPRSWRARFVSKVLSIMLFPLTLHRNYKLKRDTRLLRNSSYFDREWYLAHNPDVLQAGVDPARHYLIHGGFEDRDPGPNFASGWYLENNLDVKLAAINPLVHYLKFGQREGRAGKPDTSKQVVEEGQPPRELITPHDEQIEKDDSSILASNRVTHKPDRYSTNYLDELATAQSLHGSEYEPFESEGIPTQELPANLIAFYLPQYHPIPENDMWWGKGFTEWINVSKAVPQFVGHYQPHLPGELGFYDLRVPEVQRRQVELAKKYGIYGFCFYYYWFDGKRLLEGPLEQFASDTEIDLPFCLCWANENWTRRWDGLDDEILIAQTHSEDSDYRFIRDIAPYFRSDRYIHIENRPLLLVYRANILNNPLETTKRWREFAIAEGFGNPFLVAAQVFGYCDNPEEIGFDAALEFPPNTLAVTDISNHFNFLNPSFEGRIYDYRELSRLMDQNRVPDYKLFKAVMPSWDNTARHPESPNIFVNASPRLYENWLASAIRYTKRNLPHHERFVFINAWNEWAEGTHLEPDRKYGYAFLQATANALQKAKEHKGSWKILFISHDAHLGGAQLSLLSMVRWFIDHTNVEVKVLCLDGGKLLLEFEQLSEILLYSDIAHLSNDERITRLLEFCEGPPDLIYANSMASGKVFSWLERLGVPILTHVHELNLSIKHYAADWIDDVIRYSDAYVACSEAVRQNLIEEYQINRETCFTAYSFIHSSGIEPYQHKEKISARRELGLYEDKILVFGCGIGMPFRKGADLFIETAQKLLDMGERQFHFYWIGDFDRNERDSHYGAWADYIDKLQNTELRDYVTFLGSKDDPRKYMRAGDLFILSSREDPFPRVVLEAADCGLPVLCYSDAGGSPEFVKDDAGFVVPFENTKEMAAKVSFLIHNESTRNDMGTKSRERLINEITMDKVMPELLSVSRKVAGKNPRVSVIVPNYNHEHYLPRRLDSIFSQTFQDFEVYLMDDASTDESLQVLNEYSNRADVRVLVNEENSGSPFKQWLKAFSLVQGDILWIAESDDLCESDFLEKLLPAFADPQVQLAYCASKIIDEDGEVRGDYTEMNYLKSISNSRWKEPYCVSAEQEVNEAFGIKNTILNISSVLFRNTEFDANFKETIQNMHVGGDAFLILNVIKGGKIYYDSRFLNYHRRHEASIVGKVLSEADDTQLHHFFSDFTINKKFVARNFQLSPDFPERLERYLAELWEILAADRPYEDLKLYFPLDEVMERIKQHNLEKS